MSTKEGNSVSFVPCEKPMKTNCSICFRVLLLLYQPLPHARNKGKKQDVERYNVESRRLNVEASLY